MHVDHNIQVVTGRRTIVITAWPFWPAATANDKFYRSFITGLTPGVRYIWVPTWIQNTVIRTVGVIARLVGKVEDQAKPRGLNSTVRYRSSSTENVNILNQRDPIALEIPVSHEAELEFRLRDLGVPKDRWFVLVHAREDGWFKKIKAYDHKIPTDYSYEQEDHRNVDIKDFYPAIEYIKSMGGMVIRMGDPSMTPITGIDGVIDYPFTEHWSMPMDLYLVSKCRFVLGCNSGFAMFALVFNKPILVTNYPCASNTAFLPYTNDIFIFMHAIEKSTGRAVSPDEMCHPRLYAINPYMDDTASFSALGYEWQKNSPEEILEAVQEMDRLVETDSFDVPPTTEQAYFHQNRLQILDSLWSATERKGMVKYSAIRSSRSRVSAPYAARHFTASQN